MKSAGIEDDHIIQLDRGLVIEDLLDISVYVYAINEELRRSFGDKYALNTTDLPSIERPKEFEKWCTDKGIKAPKKTKIAQHVIDQRRDRTLVSTEKRSEVLRLYSEIARVLDL